MHERIARVDTISEDGSFSMTLATEAEASDGHILSIRGGQIPEHMPLLVSHWNDPSGTAGSITSPLKDSPPRLRAIGQVELEGEGAPAEIRRDLAHMIRQGHVGAVSVRWDDVPGKSIRRVNLPGDHPFFVDAEKETDPRKRFGIYFEEWRALEGSVVAVGADPQALIGRALETEGDVQTFWRNMATDLDPRAEQIGELATLAEACRVSGHRPVDIINAVSCDDWDAADIKAVRLGVRTFFLPVDLAERVETLLEIEHEVEVPDLAPEDLDHWNAECLRSLMRHDLDGVKRAEAKANELLEAPDLVSEPEPADPPARAKAWDSEQLRQPLDISVLVKAFSDAIDESDNRRRQTVQNLLDQAQGKVNR
jgi:hypothetical protein